MAWVPPIACPAPPFGIDDERPTPTLYVNATTGSDANAGTIGSPKATIPRALAAGTRVQVSGAQTFTYSSPNGLVSSGTSGSPVWIMSDPANPMSFTHAGEINGTYCIIDGGSSVGWAIRDGAAGTDTNHICFRNMDVTVSGFGIAPFSTGVVSYIVLYAMTIHGLGTISAGEAGGDHHGVTIEKADHVWVVDSLLYLCSGDGVQVRGGTTHADGVLTHHIYLGRNICLLNRQTGLWTKYCEDVVMSQNIVTLIRPVEEPPAGSGVYPNPAAGLGAQYDSTRLVIIGNIVTNCEYGIKIATYDAGTTGDVRIIGNKLYNLHRTVAATIPPGAALTLYGGKDRTVGNNTIYDVDYGMTSSPYAGGSITALNNIFSTTVTQDVLWDTLTPTLTYNLYRTTAKLSPVCSNFNAVTGDPLFTNAPSDFTIPTSSPAYKTGFGYDLSTAHQAIHGVPLGIDLTVTPNIGAEQGAAAVVSSWLGMERRPIHEAWGIVPSGSGISGQ